jgi:peptide/nickel transport system substrate-binding protein
MNGREAVKTFLIPLFAAIILLFEIALLVEYRRLHEKLNRLEGIVASTCGGHETARTAGNPTYITGREDHDGEWLVWAFRVEPRTLNPVSAEADIYTTWITIPYVFEPLLAYDLDSGKLVPCLAKSYDISGDGLEVTFELKEDVHFSDGTPVTADDVVFTFQTIVHPKIDAANIAGQYADVTAVTKVSDHVVKFQLRQPSFKAIERLSFCRSTGILPRHIYQFGDPEQFNKRVSNPVGSGPYIFERWDVGRQVVLCRNENYWGDKPAVKRVVYRFIPNPVAAVQALRRHEVDIMIPEPEQYAELVCDKAFTEKFLCLSYWTPATPFYYVGWNNAKEPFCDRRVRLAMTHIIDRSRIITHLLEGLGEEITGPFGSLTPANDPEIKPWAYDPEAAAQLLEQAGWHDSDGDGLRDKNGRPFRFRFTYSGSYALYERFARVLKDSSAGIGVDVILEPCEWSILSARLNNRQFDAYIAGWSADAMEDAYKFFHSSQVPTAGCNYVSFSNPQADELVEQIQRTLDGEQRCELYRRLHAILHEEQPYTFLFTRPSLRLVDRRFKHVIVHKLGLNYLEWYVPAEAQRYE